MLNQFDEVSRTCTLLMNLQRQLMVKYLCISKQAHDYMIKI
jgi:hypothetical protein